MNFNINLFIRFFDKFVGGYLVTIKYTAIGVVISLAVGIVFGLVLSLKPKIISQILNAYVVFFRETPLIVQMYLIYYGLPYYNITLSAPVSGLLAIVLNESAFIAEIVRGGIEALGPGQHKAAISLGFTPLQSLLLVEFPQTVRSIAPALTSQISYILQDTALFTMITITELTTTARALNSKYLIPGTAFIGAAIFYVVTFWAIQIVSNLLQRRRKWN